MILQEGLITMAVDSYSQRCRRYMGVALFLCLMYLSQVAHLLGVAITEAAVRHLSVFSMEMGQLHILDNSQRR